MEARVVLNTSFNTGQIDPRIFSGFLEHLGRSIYEGVYDPESDLTDDDGIRTDVAEAMTGMDMPYVRYPGGNFVSNYDWRDGVGPNRQPFPDFSWKTTDPNTFGTDEFMKWCKLVGTEPMMAVNLGTLGPAEAAALVEYCNLNTDTRWAQARRDNGSPEPHAVKMWCLCNEMDGPWQAGHMPAEQYALKARNAARLMRGLDPSIELIAAGSSGRQMETYLEWDRTVLETCWDDIEFISAHRYSSNAANNTPEFLAEGVVIDSILDDYAGLIAYVKGVKQSDRDVHVSFDEWNVWYKERGGVAQDGKWDTSPALLEEVYNLEDALVCAQYMNSFIRRADVVKVACLAQLVNVIAAVLTRTDGMLKQSIYYPFALYSKHATGISLTPAVHGDTYDAGERSEVEFIDASASFDEASGELALFIVNRSVDQDSTVTIDLSDRTITGAGTVQILTGDHPKLANTWEQPENVVPSTGTSQLENGVLTIDVPKLGMAVVSGVTTE
ncbi:alpha-N-arabinofuranosidase [Candidatus Lucifugimonas marina]|uniref:non-reducing end alpha-L-arabinofuranosidase n=1 Tax=Candidatus Lucifugimonas marina TaxID=3038979 RepID=A0AAJ5ZHG0_9CHLR|nr:alpha-N-arabinofuranosidase [SAR202 cluster bacterium JH1073]